MTTWTIRVDYNSAFAIAFFLIHALFSQNSIGAFYNKWDHVIVDHLPLWQYNNHLYLVSTTLFNQIFSLLRFVMMGSKKILKLCQMKPSYLLLNVQLCMSSLPYLHFRISAVKKLFILYRVSPSELSKVGCEEYRWWSQSTDKWEFVRQWISSDVH